ncbi:hypothetical protein GCM10009651_20500 [Microbacterium natoriense]|uniref:SIR2 family protein n=1 Tax=Microbacterium natoriense TaxID=284570 RepID=UPI0031E09F94
MSDNPIRPRIAVLLGAGASMDAGLPSTYTFARALLDAVRQNNLGNSPLVQTLHFIYGAMVNQRTEQGGDPFEAVNVETMISAIRLLRDRASHEVTPFIQGWKPQVGAHHQSSLGQHGQTIANRIAGGQDPFFAGPDIENAVRSIVGDVIHGSTNGAHYAALETEIRTHVRNILLNTTDVSYLSPLIDLASTQPGGLDVATLNYDLTVETCAAERGVLVDRGGEELPLGALTPFDPDAPLRLYKIHGSIDLYETTDRTGALGRSKLVRDHSDNSFAPAIVIGDRDKLGSGGRTIALLVAFARALHNATRLVVVGYSFADAHINDLILEWLDGDPSRELVVLDPGWPEPHLAYSDYRAALTKELANANPPRIRVIRARASKQLERALRDDIPVPPDPRLDITAAWNGATLTLRIANHGERLSNVTIDETTGGWLSGSIHLLSLDDADTLTPESTPHVRHRWSTPTLDTGATVSIAAVFSERPDTVELDVSARESARHVRLTIYVDGEQVRVEPNDW